VLSRNSLREWFRRINLVLIRVELSRSWSCVESIISKRSGSSFEMMLVIVYFEFVFHVYWILLSRSCSNLLATWMMRDWIVFGVVCPMMMMKPRTKDTFWFSKACQINKYWVVQHNWFKSFLLKNIDLKHFFYFFYGIRAGECRKAAFPKLKLLIGDKFC